MGPKAKKGANGPASSNDVVPNESLRKFWDEAKSTHQHLLHVTKTELLEEICRIECCEDWDFVHSGLQHLERETGKLSWLVGSVPEASRELAQQLVASSGSRAEIDLMASIARSSKDSKEDKGNPNDLYNRFDTKHQHKKAIEAAEAAGTSVAVRGSAEGTGSNVMFMSKLEDGTFISGDMSRTTNNLAINFAVFKTSHFSL